MLANGHVHADEYPLAALVFESNLVDERINSLEVTRAVLLQGAVSSILSKEGGRAFTKQITRLLNK